MFSKLSKDVRIPQIIIMSAILFLGILRFDFAIFWPQILLTFSAGLIAQWVFQKILAIPPINPSSTIITCLGLCFLLRSDTYWAHPLFVSLAVASKFLIRWKASHIFNPSTFGVALALLIAPGVWVSPGQWGFGLLPALWLCVLGSFLAQRAHRVDISVWFLAFYFLGLGLRNIWLGYEWTVWTHSLTNGSVILFALYMISDPRTSPRHPQGRLIQAFFVAGLALIFKFYFYINNGFLFALMLSAPLVLWLNTVFPAQDFNWRGAQNSGATLGLSRGKV